LPDMGGRVAPLTLRAGPKCASIVKGAIVRLKIQELKKFKLTIRLWACQPQTLTPGVHVTIMKELSIFIVGKFSLLVV